jgi:methionine-R-sulfoxide reductase
MGNNYNPLNSEEQRVIINKGTEPPFSGIYWDNKENGTYLCKQCNTPLFTSSSKFDSRTGWPSFDDMIDNNVKELPDRDGRRVEIVCATCGGHLGHVFKGEGFTSKNTRHCVNSISLNFQNN